MNTNQLKRTLKLEKEDQITNN